MAENKKIETKKSKYLQPTKASHFVKNEYLKQWSSDGEHIFRSLNGGPFALVSSRKICTERYMYKIEKLGENELIFLKYLYNNSPDVVKKQNDIFLENWQLVCYAADQFIGTKYEYIARNMKIQVGEDMQTVYENAYTETIMNSLLKYDESFLDDHDEKLNFSIFLFSQYLRTQKIKNYWIKSNEEVLQEKISDFQINPELLWKVLITILTNMASHELLCKENTHIQFILSDDEKLITGDQPVINIAINKQTDFIKFYYPINPNIGLIFPVEKYGILKNDQKIITYLNNEIKKNSLRYIFKK